MATLGPSAFPESNPGESGYTQLLT
jgi:hypothetical protein